MTNIEQLPHNIMTDPDSFMEMDMNNNHGMCGWAQDLKLIEDCIQEVNQGLSATQEEYWWYPLHDWGFWFSLRLSPPFQICSEFVAPSCTSCPHYKSNICGPIIGQMGDPVNCIKGIADICFRSEPELDFDLMITYLKSILKSMKKHQF